MRNNNFSSVITITILGLFILYTLGRGQETGDTCHSVQTTLEDSAREANFQVTLELTYSSSYTDPITYYEDISKLVGGTTDATQVTVPIPNSEAYWLYFDRDLVLLVSVFDNGAVDVCMFKATLPMEEGEQS